MLIYLESLYEYLKYLLSELYQWIIGRPKQLTFPSIADKTITINNDPTLYYNKAIGVKKMIQVYDKEIDESLNKYVNKIVTINKSKCIIHNVIDGFHTISLLTELDAEECRMFVNNLIVYNKMNKLKQINEQTYSN